MSEITYDAFISYRSQHEKFAAELEKALEAYSPQVIEGGRQRDPGPLNIFRDGEDLAGSSVSGALEKNLDRSAKLVVLCSPGAASSSYVNHEIAHFARKHGSKDIIALLVEGHPNERHHPPEDNAFPQALLDVLEDPLAIDCRAPFQNGESLAHPNHVQEWHKLLGRLLDVDPVTFQQRERRRMMRRMWTGAAASLTLVSAFGALAAYAFEKEQRAEEARDSAESAMAKTKQALEAETLAKQEAQQALAQRDQAKVEAREATTDAERQKEAASEAAERAKAAEGAAQTSKRRAQAARSEAESEKQAREQLRRAAIEQIGQARHDAEGHRANADELRQALMRTAKAFENERNAADHYWQKWNEARNAAVKAMNERDVALYERDSAWKARNTAVSERDAVAQDRDRWKSEAFKWHGIAKSQAAAQAPPAADQVAYGQQ